MNSPHLLSGDSKLLCLGARKCVCYRRNRVCYRRYRGWKMVLPLRLRADARS